MQVKLRLLACMLAVLVAFNIFTCTAAEVSTGNELTINILDMDERTGEVTVEGKVGSNLANAVVSMVVYYPDDYENAVNPEEVLKNKDAIFTIDEKKVEADGSFEFNFTISEGNKPGWYLVRFGVKGLTFDRTTESEKSRKVKLMSTQDKEEIKTAFNNATTHTALKTLFTEHGGLFNFPTGYDTTDYDGTFEEEFNGILIDYRGTYYPNGVSSVADIQSVIKASEIIYKLKALARSQLETYLSDYKDELKIDTENTEYNNLKANVLDELFDLIDTNALVNSWKMLSSEFKETVILEAFSNTNREQAGYLLDKYSEDIGISVDGDYTKVDPVEMGKAFEDKTFETTELIKETFETRLSDLLLLLEQQSGSDNPQSGGVSSGGDRVYSVPGASGGASEPGAASSGFTDIADVKWAEEAITALKNRGIIAGITPTLFYPYNAVTREQFVKMAVAAFGVSWLEGEIIFSDIDQSAWYAPYISKAVNAGIINGQGEIFGIGQGITRQDVAVILYRILGNRNHSTAVPEFKDYDEIAPYAREAVCAMYSLNILSGDDNGYFNPTDACTRAEAAKLIYGALNIMEKGE